LNPPEPVVFVVDDDPSVRSGLARLLKSMGLAVQAFASAREFLELVVTDKPGCLIVDLRMPAMSGLELQEQLKSRSLNLPIIFLTGFGTVPATVRAMKAGAVDFLEKPVDDQTLIDTVFRALDLDREQRVKQAEVQVVHDRLKSLTPREVEVFRLIITGRLNKQVASELNTSEKTIKVHRARILEKMQCQSLAELVRLAAKANLHWTKVQ
jgi:FixJ family two-component response regulator